MIKRVKKIFKDLVYDYVYSPGFFRIVYFRDWKKIERNYGEFEGLSRLDIRKYTLSYNPGGNVCSQLTAEIVKMISDLKVKPKSVLLDGDTKLVVEQFRDRFGLEGSEILTTGIDDDFDYDWNFENDIPKSLADKRFDLIISQAMLEHLIDPYKHFLDLSKLLNKNGYLAIHTDMPGYNYHRYPIDAVRFFPDWFEGASKRLGLKVVRKFRRDFSIKYLLRKWN